MGYNEDMSTSPSIIPDQAPAAIADYAKAIQTLCDERCRRILLGGLIECLGRGGMARIQEYTGISKVTLIKGKEDYRAVVDRASADVENGTSNASVEEDRRVRREGGGRKVITEKYPDLDDKILKILEAHGSVLGTPEKPLLWTTQSTYSIAQLLEELHGIKVSAQTVARRLDTMGFSLQKNRKHVESGKQSPDRDAQFRHISEKCSEFISENQPVISVDAKKKELIGNYKNDGQEYRKSGDPRKVNDHDFVGPEGKAVPYGIYDIGANKGYVNVGISADTAEFACVSIKRWWDTMGKSQYPNATKLMITADCGGSNSSRGRLWKIELQKLADCTGLEIHVSHFPPGTSKWNKIEHRLFAQISRSWRGIPLETLAIIVALIGATTTNTGLEVQCELDQNIYQRGIKISDAELASINLKRDELLGDWNYVIYPSNATN